MSQRLKALLIALGFGGSVAFAGGLDEHQASGHCVDAVDPADCPVVNVVETVPVEVYREVEVVREVKVPEVVVESIGASVSTDTSSGSDIPSVSVIYEREGDGFEAFVRASTGPNLAGKQGSSATVSVERDFGYVSVEGGYDRRAVSFQEVGNAGRVVFYGTSVGETAAVNGDFDFGSVNFEVGVNILDVAPRMALSTKVMGVDVDADVTRFQSTGWAGTMRASHQWELADGWSLEAFGSYTYGIDNVPDPIVWHSDVAGAVPNAPPVDAYSAGFGIRKRIQ